MTLNRRILRDLKTNAIKYLALFILLTCGIGVLAGMAASVDSILETNAGFQRETNLEDGSFETLSPLKDSELRDLEEMNVLLEEESHIDLPAETSEKDTGLTLRVFVQRQKIDKVKILEGREAKNSDEVVLEKLCAAAKSLSPGDSISIGSKTYKISGIGCTADYNYLLQNLSDVAKNVNSFSTAFVTADEFSGLRREHTVSCTYAYRLGEGTSDRELKDYLLTLDSSDSVSIGAMSMFRLISGAPNLCSFTEASNNLRITNYADDAKINKKAALLVGTFFFILVAFILSIFALQNIDRERAVIGTLYALGCSRKQVILSFIALPLITTLAGGICGVILGYFLIDPLGAESVDTFSYPGLERFYLPYIILFCVAAPVIFTAIINYTALSRRLNKPPVTLLRKQAADSSISGADLSGLTFKRRFMIRQLLRERGLTAILLVGMFLAILIMVMGFSVKGSIDYYVEETDRDLQFGNMYLMKYPVENAPSDAEKAYTETLLMDYAATGGTASVTLQGIQEDSDYFAFDAPKNKDSVLISNSAAIKFGLRKGDTVYLTDDMNDRSYRFTVRGITKYTNGCFMFMDIDAMRDRFGQEDNYYNTLYSGHELAIHDEDAVAFRISRKDISSASALFVDQMAGTILLLIVLSILVMIITIFLLISIMMEKSKYSISLTKALGYDKRSIERIFLRPGTVTVAAATVISVPLSKCIMNYLFPYLVTNFPSGMEVVISPKMYAEIFILIIVTYTVISFVLKRQLAKIPLTEILKNVE